MNAVAPHDPLFFPVSASSFHRELIADLAAGRCAAIEVREFMPRDTCAEILRALETVSFETYNTKRIFPPVMRFGVGVSDHNVAGVLADTYWEALQEHRQAWRALRLPYDPYDLCRKGLAAHWPYPVSVATRDGRPLGDGVIREPNGGFQVHFDDAKREFTGSLIDGNLIAQFAFNLYLSVPEVGGETVVWRHRWHPADEAMRLSYSTYGYPEDVVGDAEFFELWPTVGSALLFDPGNFHAVRPSKDSRRIAIGFAVGLVDTGELVTWG